MQGWHYGEWADFDQQNELEEWLLKCEVSNKSMYRLC